MLSQICPCNLSVLEHKVNHINASKLREKYLKVAILEDFLLSNDGVDNFS